MNKRIHELRKALVLRKKDFADEIRIKTKRHQLMEKGGSTVTE